MTPEQVEAARRLRAEMARIGIGVRALAGHLGVGYRRVSKWISERHEDTPSPAVLCWVAAKRPGDALDDWPEGWVQKTRGD